MHTYASNANDKRNSRQRFVRASTGPLCCLHSHRSDELESQPSWESQSLGLNHFCPFLAVVASARLPHHSASFM